MPGSGVSDGELAAQFERVVRRVKQSMNYRGSYSTRDILDSLIARWLQSGEWERLKALPPEERKIGESVRRFILDRFDQLRRRGEAAEVDDDALSLPDDTALAEIVELAELRQWITARVGELESGKIDARVVIPLGDPKLIGAILRGHLDGQTQRELAGALKISVGAVNKRLAEGTNYLVVLQGIEQGIGVAP